MKKVINNDKEYYLNLTCILLFFLKLIFFINTILLWAHNNSGNCYEWLINETTLLGLSCISTLLYLPILAIILMRRDLSWFIAIY